MLKYRIFVGLVLAGLLGTVVSAEVRNETDVYRDNPACTSYTAFLRGENVQQTTGCNSLETYSIENMELGNIVFLERFVETFPKRSGLSILARGQIAAILGDEVEAIVWLDIADRQLFSFFNRVGDLERASLYSGLISGVKMMVIRSFCEELRSDCSSLDAYIRPEDVIAGFPLPRTESRLDIVMLCLLRTDGFSVSIRELVFSDKFRSCVGM